MGAALLTTVLIVLALGALLVAVLFVPVDYAVSTGTEGVGVRIGWLFGLVRVERPVRHGRRKPKQGPAEKRAHHPPRTPDRAARTAGQLLAIEGLLSHAGRLVLDCTRSLGWQRARISVRAGTGDPADTGELYGLVCSLQACLPAVPATTVEFEPDFLEPVFDAQAEGSGRFVPARLVRALGRFALSRPGLRAIKVIAWDSRR
jgi:DUF2953 family protein